MLWPMLTGFLMASSSPRRRVPSTFATVVFAVLLQQLVPIVGAADTKYPTSWPSKYPTSFPSKRPTKRPTSYPTKSPSVYPTKFPTKSPTKYPTKYPSGYPTKFPTTYDDRCEMSEGGDCPAWEGDCDNDDECEGDLPVQDSAEQRFCVRVQRQR